MRNRNAAIDLWKFIFACVIVLFHANKYMPGQSGYFVNGRLATEFFFLVSGFLMAATAERYFPRDRAEGGVWRATGSYIAHRIKRLLPEILIAWLVAFAVVMVAEHSSFTDIARKLLYGLHDFLLLRSAGLIGSFAPNIVTWYISAMLLAMALCFPLLLAKRECFLHWFAPLAAIFLYGYMYSLWPNGLHGHATWSGLATKGLFRALAGILLGVNCYSVAQKLGQLRLKASGRLLATAAEAGCLLFVIWHMYHTDHSLVDYTLVLLMAVSVTILFSGVSYSALLSSSAAAGKICSFLGEFSLDLYLSHIYWARELDKLFSGLTGNRLLLLLLVLSFANALLLMFVSKWLRKQWPVIRSWLRRGLLEESGPV